MKRTMLFAGAVLFGILALSLVYSGGVPSVHAEGNSEDGCSAATLKGSYGFNTLTGFVRLNPRSSRFIPDVAAGLVTLDGGGGFTGKATNVTNGDIAPETPPFAFALVGTYTLDSDCTGSLTEINSGTHFNLVVVNNGKEIEALQTDPQETRTLQFKRIRLGEHE